MTFLLDTALDGSSVVFLPWSAGVMTRFEHDFYAGKIHDGALTPRGGRWSASTRGSRRRANGPRPSATPPPRPTSTTMRRSIMTTRSPRRSSSSSTTTSRGRSSSRTRATATTTATSGSATSSAASSRRARRGTGTPCSARRPARGSRPAHGRLLRAPDRMAGAGEPGAGRGVELHRVHRRIGAARRDPAAVPRRSAAAIPRGFSLPRSQGLRTGAGRGLLGTRPSWA